MELDPELAAFVARSRTMPARASPPRTQIHGAPVYDPMHDTGVRLCVDPTDNCYTWTWSQFNERLDTADVMYILCKTLTGRLLCFCTCTAISHVALIIVLTKAVQHIPRGRYLMEAVWRKDNLYDYLSQTRGRAGVRLVDLYEKMYHEQFEADEVRVHRMEKIDTRERTLVGPKIVEWLLAQGPLGYDANIVNLAFTWLDFPGAALVRKKAVHEYVCSEIVARALIVGGLLDPATVCENTTPGDFCYHKLHFMHGSQVTVQPELLLSTIPRPDESILREWEQRPVATPK